jgi:hypothetical protein
MADQLLVNVLSVSNLGVGASVVVAHGLRSNGHAVTPAQVVADRASPIVVAACDASSVTFTNNGGSAASANFRVEVDHTSHAAPGTAPLYWNGVDVAANPSGVFDHIDFATTPLAARAERRLRWNQDEGTLELGLRGGNVTLQVGQENIIRVRNDSGANMVDGQVVYQAGSTGANISVELAQANSVLTAHTIFGVVTEHIAKTQEGFITTFGLVHDLDTNHLDEGKPVWLSPTVAGGTTKTQPIAPLHSVQIGYCVRKHPSLGAIFVLIDNGNELSDLHDVLATSPRTGDVLTYNSITGLWTEGQPLWVSQTQTALELLGGEQITVDDAVYRPIAKRTGAAGNITLAANPITSLTSSEYGRELWLVNVDATRSIILPAGGNTMLSGGVNLTLAPGTMAKFIWTSLGGGKWFQHASAITAS